jgi:hypothetical protein
MNIHHVTNSSSYSMNIQFQANGLNNAASFLPVLGGRNGTDLEASDELRK